ncbi:uncharacterized protein ACB058_010947 [Synchiropus picturatus]
MATIRPPVPLLCILLCVCVALQRSDMRLTYVTHNSFFYYSCSQEPPPCSISSLTECRCKDITLSMLQRPQSHSSPVFRMRRLTVWYTSPLNTARLLNNSEVRHLTLVHCGPPRDSYRSAVLEGHFAVQHLERLSVLHLQLESKMNRDSDNRAHLDSNTYLEVNEGASRHSGDPAEASSSPQIQDIYLGRELGAEHQEQARLGIIDSSVLECAASMKVYTVQTHIDSDGVLPFPDLKLPKLPQTSVIYVSFVY